MPVQLLAHWACEYRYGHVEFFRYLHSPVAEGAARTSPLVLGVSGQNLELEVPCAIILVEQVSL